MSGSSIPQLTAASTLTGAEQIYVVQNSLDRRSTAGAIASLAGTAAAPLVNLLVGGTLTVTGATALSSTLSVSGAVSGAGITALFASPPAVGGTVPSSGAFTTLSASSTVSGAGVTARFASPGPIGSTAASTAAFTQVSQAFTSALSGGSFPPGVIGFLTNNHFTGTVSAGNSGPLGSQLEFNSFAVHDDVNYTRIGSGGKAGASFNMWTTGGRGSSAALVAQYYFNPQSGYAYDVGNGPYIGPFQTNITVDGNITSSTSIAPVGAFFGGGSQIIVNANGGGTPTNVAEVVGWEFDFGVDATSTAYRVEGIKIVNQSAVAFTPTNWGVMLSMSTNGGVLPYGITFGSAFGVAGSDVPVSTTGTLIYTYGPKTLGIGIDFSAATFGTAFIKGPNSFKITDAGYTYTPGVIPATGNTTGFYNAALAPILEVVNVASSVNNITISNAMTGNAPIITSSGTDAIVGMNFKTAAGAGNYEFRNSANNAEFQIVGVASVISYPKLTPAASGAILFDVGGTASDINIGSTTASGVSVGRAAGNLGFYGTAPIAKQTGVAVTDAAIHAALVALGLFAA